MAVARSKLKRQPQQSMSQLGGREGFTESHLMDTRRGPDPSAGRSAMTFLSESRREAYLSPSPFS